MINLLVLNKYLATIVGMLEPKNSISQKSMQSDLFFWVFKKKLGFKNSTEYLEIQIIKINPCSNF